MFKMRITKNTLSRGHLYVIAPIVLICLTYGGASEQPSAPHSYYRSTSTGIAARRSHRQIARLRTLAGGQRTTTSIVSMESCFASTEDEARSKLIATINASNPPPGEPIEDHSYKLPSPTNYVCGDGLSEEELAGLSKALNVNAKLTSRLVVDVQVENAPDPRMAHLMIQNYLGRERYLNHLSHCLTKNKREQLDIVRHSDTFITSFLGLSSAQQAAFIPLREKMTAIIKPETMEVLDEQGEMVELNPQRAEDFLAYQQKLLPLAEEVFSILTEEQARRYKALATDEAYSSVINQYQLTQDYLPVPEQLREAITLNSDALNQQDTTPEPAP